MNNTRTPARLAAWTLAALLTSSALGQMELKDTFIANRFEFTQREYVVDEDATNAVIWVRFHPGHRGISGQVSYRTEDGTAIADQDYIPVSGTLYFSRWANRSFTVPIIWDSTNEPDKTVHLKLLPGFKTIVGPQSNAVLRITDVRPPLKLQLTPAADGIIQIAWPADRAGCLLEKCETPASSKWVTLTNKPSSIRGKLIITDTLARGSAFYRLREP